ncbi:DUF2934 domain-containing protein [Neorhizobium sp. P12A]|uniref:DUF2934 domain-containing protein n=1 Tax=Neorhizobium sp. P12A TaxID=2268027 RepID=UPI0011ED6B80|nr:DUF2934 domain-containing protein [Neorhizobium sp. P12A]KAA0690223.1 DUF2934 domain-containing protein [Neorhizobium sp. P12A]
MGTDLQERIRHRAYEIWESEGRPERQDVRHWLQASKELGNSAESDKNGQDDRDQTALLQGAGESGDFAARRDRPRSAGDPAEVEITTGEQSVRQSVRKTEGP